MTSPPPDNRQLADHETEDRDRGSDLYEDRRPDQHRRGRTSDHDGVVTRHKIVATTSDHFHGRDHRASHHLRPRRSAGSSAEPRMATTIIRRGDHEGATATHSGWPHSTRQRLRRLHRAGDHETLDDERLDLGHGSAARSHGHAPRAYARPSRASSRPRARAMKTNPASGLGSRANADPRERRHDTRPTAPTMPRGRKLLSILSFTLVASEQAGRYEHWHRQNPAQSLSCSRRVRCSKDADQASFTHPWTVLGDFCTEAAISRSDLPCLRSHRAMSFGSSCASPISPRCLPT